MSEIETLTQLKEAWGPKRYVEALGAVVGAVNKHGDLYLPLDIMQELTSDELDVYGAYIAHGIELLS
jgi:hypothetical protein